MSREWVKASTATRVQNVAVNTNVKNGPGVLRRIIVSGTATGNVIVYNSLTNTAIVATLYLDVANASRSFEFNTAMSTGISITPSAATLDITVIYD